MLPSSGRPEIEGLTDGQQTPHAFDKYRLLACLFISLFLISWITLAAKGCNIRVIVFFLILPYLLLRTGGIITRSLALPASFTLDFLIGVVAISVAVMTWKIFVPFSLWILLLILFVSVVAVSKVLAQPPGEPMPGFELLAIIVSLAATTAWSQDLITPIKTIGGSFLFKPWSDFFFHATIVARSLGSQTLLQAGNYEWKGMPAIVYHYASYSLTICLVKATNVPAYNAVVGFWAPFGCFLSGISAYALGRVFWGHGAGLAALTAVIVIPDAALLNIGHPYYGYHWLQEIEPAGLYGVTIAGTALVIIAQGMRAGRRAWIVSGVFLGALVAFFKVHIFAASFPLIFSFAVLAWPARLYRRWLVLGSCVALALIVVELMNYFHIGPDVHFDFSGGAWYWKVLANMAKKTPVENWYTVFNASSPFPSYLPRAIGLLLGSALGIFVILAPLTWILAVRCKNWEVANTLSLIAITIFLLMTFTLSRNTTLGLPDELIHRPFIWAYWLVGSLTAGYLFSIVALEKRHVRPWTVGTGLLGLVLIPTWYGSGLQLGKWPGARTHSSLPIDRGLVECARYIRNQPPTDALAQDSSLESPFPILTALSERPSFATRTKFWLRISKTFRGFHYREQLQLLEDLKSAGNLPDLQRGARETGIRWLLCHPDDHYSWPAEFLDHPVFESDGYKVYDMQRAFDLHG
jgi:hypothetical protein